MNPVCSKFILKKGLFRKIEVRIFEVEMPLVCLQSVILLFPGHTHLLLLMYYKLFEVVIIM